MEAWILSQPDKIEQYVAENFVNWKRRKAAKDIKDDNILKGNIVQEISEPDKKLNTLLQRYFLVEKRGKSKKIKYQSKTRDGAAMLELLEFQSLKNSFPEIKRLAETLQSLIQNQ